MNKIKTLLSIIFLAVLVSACAAPAATPTAAPTAPAAAPAATSLPTALPTKAPTVAPVPTSTSPSPTATMQSTSPADLLAYFKNFTFQTPNYQKTVTLKNGSYENGSGADYGKVNVLDQITVGDLNSDGKPEVAVLLAENGGGTGTFVSVVVLRNQDGKWVQSGSILVDDRPKINNLTNENGKIILDAVIHGGQDPMCCPNLPVLQTYVMTENGLVLQRLVSATPNGSPRAITISEPLDEAQVSGSTTVKGSVTIAPFENNLVYHIIDTQGNKLAEGPITVTTKDMGEPGTFEATIDLSKIPAGQAVRLQVLDLSAADGSTLAMDSIALNIK